MAISAGMKWQVQNGGDDTNNGGGFRGGSIKSAPSAPGLATATTGGSIAANTYKVVVTITDGNGETSLSAESSIATTGAASTITVTAPTNPNDQGATWNVYCGTAAGGPYFSQSTGNAFGSNKVITTTPPTSGTQAPGVDYSQQNTAQVVVDLVTITATTTGANSNTLTFTLGYTPSKNDVGNTFQATGGTNINAGIYEITGWSATTWTVSGAQNLTTAGGAGTLVTGSMGGAHATLGKAIGFRVGGNDFYVKYNATPYAMANSNNVAGGNVNFSTNAVNIIGYNTTRTRDNTDALRPTFQASANSMTLFTTNNSSNSLIANLILDANTHTTVVGMTASSVVRNCKFMGGLSTGITVAAAQVTDCYATGCGTSFSLSGAGSCQGCVSSLHTVRGFDLAAGGAACIRCIADITTTAAAVGFAVRSSTGIIDQCVAYGHTGSGAFGFDWITASASAYNCVAYGNATNFATNGSAVSACVNLFSCANGGATSTELTSLFSNQLHGQITLSADPFTNAAGGDYSTNTTAGGGALLRAAGWPSSFPGISTSNYLDVGAVQHVDTAPTGFVARKSINAGGAPSPVMAW